MGIILPLEADAFVRRLSNNTFLINSDLNGIYLVHAATREQVCIARFDGAAEAEGEKHFRAATAALSDRERQVLEMLGQGDDMHEISSRLGLSVKTIETYRARLKRKLGIQNRSRLLALAVELRVQRPASLDGSPGQSESRDDRTPELNDGPLNRCHAPGRNGLTTACDEVAAQASETR
jgi:DNA-binding CsgD family transcriptional regulator